MKVNKKYNLSAVVTFDEVTADELSDLLAIFNNYFGDIKIDPNFDYSDIDHPFATGVYSDIDHPFATGLYSVTYTVHPITLKPSLDLNKHSRYEMETLEYNIKDALSTYITNAMTRGATKAEMTRLINLSMKILDAVKDKPMPEKTTHVTYEPLVYKMPKHKEEN